MLVVQLSAEPDAFLYGIKFMDADPSVKLAIVRAVR